MNAALPPATYASGLGVAESLALPRPSACAGLAAAAAAQQEAQGPAAGEVGANGHSGSLFRFAEAYPAAPQDHPLRRASISVEAWQAEAAAAHAPGAQLAGVEEQPGGSSSGGGDGSQKQGAAHEAAAAAALRRRSMSDALRSKPRPAGASSLVQRAQQRRFDPSPLEFGSSPRSHGSGGVAGSGARRAPARPPAMGGGGGGASDFDDARWVGRQARPAGRLQTCLAGGVLPRSQRSTNLVACTHDRPSRLPVLPACSYYGGDGASTYGGSYHGGSYYEVPAEPAGTAGPAVDLLCLLCVLHPPGGEWA